MCRTGIGWMVWCNLENKHGMLHFFQSQEWKMILRDKCRQLEEDMHRLRWHWRSPPSSTAQQGTGCS
jgi:hypothetical protein